MSVEQSSVFQIRNAKFNEGKSFNLNPNLVKGRDLQNIRSCDQVLFQSKNFVALPTLGAIVEGWILIVPKKHQLCMGALNKELFSELDMFRKKVYDVLSACYGPIVIFEHGPSNPEQQVGCGVDYAHLHMLPFKYNLIRKHDEIFSNYFKWNPINGMKDTSKFYKKGLPYLYVEQPLGNAFITTHPNIPSQLFRRVVASSIGHPERYDWKTYPEDKNIESTISTLKAWESRNDSFKM